MEDTANMEDKTESKELKPLKKGDDDDFFGMGKKSMGKRSASTNANKMPEGLPWFKQAGGIEYVIASVPESAVLAITTSRINVEPDTILGDDDSVAATSRALLALEKLSTPSQA